MWAMYVVRDGTFEPREVPRPEAAPGQVLVKTRASSLNRGEVMMSRMPAIVGDGRVFGRDFAGEVAEVGTGVTVFKPGDRVMGVAAGAYAEYIAVDQAMTWPLADHFSYADAAAFPNVFMTAHDALVTNGELKAGQDVLVNAVSSGVGLAAVQIARLLGAARVIGVSRTADKLATVRAHGLTGEIDLSRDNQPEKVMALTDGRGVDLIADSVGASALKDSLASMALKGRLIQIGRLGGSVTDIDLDFVALRRLQIIGVTFRTRTPDERNACFQSCMRDLAGAWETGKLKAPIDRSFPFERLGEARDYVERDVHIGKVILET